jgi:hypothetical protein
LLTHLTRLTRLSTPVVLSDDPAVLPSAGASLRVLELVRDRLYDHDACIEALLPVAAGLKALDINNARFTAADAARLAAALPRDIARLRVGTSDERVWSALPVTVLELHSPPADLARLARASRLERLSVSTVSGAEPAALAAALQALPCLQALDIGDGRSFAFKLSAAPVAAAPAGAGARDAPPLAADAVDAFVAAVAGLPSLRELGLKGVYIGSKAKAALLQAAPRLSALRLSVCNLSDDAAAGLEAQLRAAAGRSPLSLEVCARDARFY